MRTCVTIFLFLFLILPIYADDSAVPLINEDYYPKVLETIKQSKKSIDVVMYIIAFHPESSEEDKVRILLNELIEAHKRGLNVRVVLDYKGNFSNKYGSRNYHAYEYLKNNEVPVFFDSAKIATHPKAVIVDGEHIFVGSHNWSTYAFEKNFEISYYEKDNQDAIKIKKVIDELPIHPLSQLEAKSEESNFFLPESWLEKNKALVKLYTDQSERAFDLLIALKAFENIDTSYTFLASKLGLDSKDETATRRAINRVLKKLSKIKVLSHKTAYKKPFHFQWVDNFGKTVTIPLTYFEWGWNGRLSHSAKIALFILLKELGEDVDLYVYFKEWEERYGIQRAFQNGRQELRKLGIIRILYSEFKDGVHTRPSCVQYLGLYDPLKREKEINELASLYGKENLEKARKWASVIYEGNQPETIETILKLMTQESEENLRYAFSYVEKYTPDNHRRSMKYVYGILRRISGEEERGVWTQRKRR